MTDIETVDKTILLTSIRLSDIAGVDIYHSILGQLSYISSILNGSETDKSNLDKIILGHFAVKEFEESDPELAKLLMKCQNIAFKLKEE